MNRKLIIFLILLVAVLTFWTAFLMNEKNNEDIIWLSRIKVIVTTCSVTDRIKVNEKKSLGEALQYVDIEKLSWEEKIRYIIASLPLCWVPNLYRTPQVISEYVQNCKRKAKKWSFPDWLWWVFLNDYTYDANSHSPVSITDGFSIDGEGNLQVDWHVPVC